MFRQGGVTIFSRMFHIDRFFAFISKQLELKILLILSLILGVLVQRVLGFTGDSVVVGVLFIVSLGLIICYQQFIIATAIGEGVYNFWKVFFGVQILSAIITFLGLMFFPVLMSNPIFTFAWISLSYALAIGILYPGRATFLDAFLLQTIISIVVIVLVFIVTGSATVLSTFIGSVVPVP